MGSLRRRGVAWTVGLALATGVTAGHALTQPGSTTPIPTGNGLQNLFTSRGEGINALNDATTLPETFKPTCKLNFEVLLRNAGFKNSFGWYNVTGVKPTTSQMFEFLTCNDGVGTSKLLNIAKDPSYLGGDVGFYEATGSCATLQSFNELFFSEKKHNPDSNQQNPFIHLLIYNSTVVKNAFYFCWEDLLSGGDNDFDDLVTFVTGLYCTGGGGTCMTGQLGICGDGTMQCQNGALACVPLNMAQPEACNGLDDDCDGDTDEGEGLCPPEHVCHGGTCVPKCGGEVYQCPPDKVCNKDGICVDPACEMIQCPDGQKCVGGTCVGPCDGVQCPYGQVCLVGKCVEVCSKIKCDPEQVCDLGVCVEACQCAGCPMAETCQMDGLCIPDACVGKTCPPGTHCDAMGNCVDDCLGAKCPVGESCVMGDCVPDPTPPDDTSSATVFMVGGGGPGGGPAASGAGGAGGAKTAGAGGNPATDDGAAEGGCSCRLGGQAPSRWWLALGAVAVALARSRAQRRSGRRWWLDGPPFEAQRRSGRRS
jgi:hypothetical protein